MVKGKRYGGLVLLMMFFFMIIPLCAKGKEAEEFIQFKAGTVWEVVRDTEVKEKPDEDAETLHVFSAGTAVLLLEDEQDGWSMVQNQSDTGYIPVEALQIYGAEDIDAMNQEFVQAEQEHIRVIEEHELVKKEQRTSFVWKVLIVIFIVIFFGTSIYDVLNRNRKNDFYYIRKNTEPGNCIFDGPIYGFFGDVDPGRNFDSMSCSSGDWNRSGIQEKIRHAEEYLWNTAYRIFTHFGNGIFLVLDSGDWRFLLSESGSSFP